MKIKFLVFALLLACLPLCACDGCGKTKGEQTLSVEQLLSSKHRLEYNEDGSFRVMTISDTHMNVQGDGEEVQNITNRIKTLVDRVNPNLVIFTGDNTINSNTKNRLRQNINALVGYIEQKQIPWCHVYGNHDHENALSNESQQSVWEEYEYCVSKDVPSLSGTGNYVLGLEQQFTR
jgi:predicted MPP superfamily phosphohydrolase